MNILEVDVVVARDLTFENASRGLARAQSLLIEVSCVRSTGRFRNNGVQPLGHVHFLPRSIQFTLY